MLVSYFLGSLTYFISVRTPGILVALAVGRFSGMFIIGLLTDTATATGMLGRATISMHTGYPLSHVASELAVNWL